MSGGTYPPVHSKPKGLWVSDEDDYGWLEWCRDNSFMIDVYEKYCYEISILPEANILRVESELSLIALSKKYGRYLEYDDPNYVPVYVHGLDWSEVAKLYDGIIISPYIWSCRFSPETFWYYGWDCASGCIWNGDIVRVGPRQEVKDCFPSVPDEVEDSE